MHTSQDVTIDRAASLRRLPVLILVSIPVTAEILFGEIIFAGHIVLLVEGLGFAWGLAAFIAIWAVLGLVVLAAADFLWPGFEPRLASFRRNLSERAAALWSHVGARMLLAALGAMGASVAVGLVVALAGGEIADWAADHIADLVAFAIAGVVVLVALLVLARIGRGIERWVRRVGDTARPATRWLATLAAMAALGPALSWLLFRLLGYSGRTTYALTLAAAPVFGAVWVPFYALGAWSLLQGLA